MVKLVVDADYTLEHDALAEALGRPRDVIEHYFLLRPMARPDGELLIGTKVYSDDNGSQKVLIALPASVLYVQNTGQAVLVPVDADLPPEPFTVRNHSVDRRITEQVTAVFRPSGRAHIVATGSKVAVPLETGSGAEWAWHPSS